MLQSFEGESVKNFILIQLKIFPPQTINNDSGSSCLLDQLELKFSKNK